MAASAGPCQGGEPVKVRSGAHKNYLSVNCGDETIDAEELHSATGPKNMIFTPDPVDQLRAELEAAGFRIEAVPSSTPVIGLDSEAKDYILRTHRIYHQHILIADAAIIPEARVSALHVISESDSAKLLREIFDRYRSRASPEKIPAKKPFSFLDVECRGCRGHGGWGGLNTPFVRCRACNGTGRSFAK
jgi:hypothetical protein